MKESISVIALIVALGACTATSEPLDDEEVCFPDEKCDSLDPNGGVAVTANRTASVLDGYNVIADHNTPACVHPIGDASYVAGQPSETLDIVYLENRNTVTTETSTALGLGLDLGVLQASALHELLRSASTSSTSINLVVRMSADYWVLNRRPLLLEGWAAGKLGMGIGPFVKACGTHYTKGVRHGAYAYALVTFNASNTQTFESIKTGLGLTLFGIVPLTPSLSQKVTQAAQQQSVTVTMQFAADGFMLDGRPASAPLLSTLLGAGIGPEFFANLDHVREQLEQSVNQDKCRDGGIGTCDGAAAPGYATNTLRNARPTGILLGAYDSVSDGVPPGADAKWAEMRDRIERNQQHLRSLQGLQDRIENVYTGEIGKFLAAFPFAVPYQRLPPATPLVRLSDLRAIANQWRQKLEPGGPARQPIRDAAHSCYRASLDLTDCAGTEAFEASPAAKAVTATLGEYAASGRIVRANFRFMIPDIASNAAASYCDGDSRLPTDKEAEFLSPMVGSPFFLNDHRVWTSAYHRCSGSDRPGLLVDAAYGVTQQICGRAGGVFTSPDRFAVICVPGEGAIPTAPPL